MQQQINSDHGLSIILAFTIGILFSRFSLGFLFVLIFIIISEIFYGTYTRCNYPWLIQVRGLVIASSILGFIIGRTVLEDQHILKPIFADEFDSETKKRYLRRARLMSDSDSDNDNDN